MISSLGHQLGSAGNCILAAIVGFRCGGALALEAAIHCLKIARSTGEAVEGPDQQYDCQEANDDLNAPPHLQFFRVTRTHAGLRRRARGPSSLGSSAKRG